MSNSNLASYNPIRSFGSFVILTFYLPLRSFHKSLLSTPLSLHKELRMTTLNPSHNVFREPEGRHAQAVRQADAASGSGSDVDGVDGDLDSRPQGVKRAKRHGRKRVKAAMPPIPDMRFEQVSGVVGCGIWVKWDIGSKPGGWVALAFRLYRLKHYTWWLSG
jgi:hypothetical protein